jgi:hypothetical protein
VKGLRWGSKGSVSVAGVDGKSQRWALVKVYDQKRTVDYADYKVGLFYMSPFDLFVDGQLGITKLEKKRSRSVRE